MENSEEFKKKMYDFFFLGPKEIPTKDSTYGRSITNKNNPTTRSISKANDVDSDSFSARLGSRGL
jgi:hypothetical protein